MYKLLLLLIGLIAAGIAFASKEYDVAWPSLESAFEAFLENPNNENSEVISRLLPPGKFASHKIGSFNAEIAEKILNRIGELDALIKSGNSNALNVAFALSEISDGEYSSWLEAVTSEAIIKNPREYLIGVKERWMSRDEPCINSAVLHWEFEGDHVSVLNDRYKAIKSVSDKGLDDVRACVGNALTKYAKEEPLQ
jgi:hypothetical protein